MTYIIKADGASRGNPGEASFGAVLFDGDKEIATVSEYLGQATNNYAEYSGVIAGLRLAINHDSNAEYLVQLDSKLVVEQLSGRWKVRSTELMPLVSKANALTQGLKVSFQWISRDQNSRADELANQALDAPETHPVPDQPSSIRSPRVTTPGTEVVFVRHGHSTHTEKSLVAGGDGADPELSELGFLEAEATAEFIAQPPAAWKLSLADPFVISSDMLRTRQTATAIANRLGIEVKLEPRIREVYFGEWNGLTNEELFSKDRQLLDSWQGSLDFAPPGGESVNDLLRRVNPFMDELREHYANRTVIVVSHMMPTRAMTHSVMGADPSYLWSTSFAPASVSAFRIWGFEQYELISLNACAHLPIN